MNLFILSEVIGWSNKYFKTLFAAPAFIITMKGELDRSKPKNSPNLLKRPCPSAGLVVIKGNFPFIKLDDVTNSFLAYNDSSEAV